MCTSEQDSSQVNIKIETTVEAEAGRAEFDLEPTTQAAKDN
jgi:hypothetical protein